MVGRVRGSYLSPLGNFGSLDRGLVLSCSISSIPSLLGGNVAHLNVVKSTGEQT